MKTLRHVHNYFSELPESVQAEIGRLSKVRHLARGEAAYRKGDPSEEIFRLLEGAIRMCNYSLDGAEIITSEFRPGDCFGEMGVIDGLPRVSHAIASTDSRVEVISKHDFDRLCDTYPQISRELNRVLCGRLRLLYTLNEESVGLRLHLRLARVLHRLAYSHGRRDERGETYIEISHEALSNMLGASRQSVSKELKSLEREGDIELRYGKIYFRDLGLLGEKYETAVGMEQVTPVYDDGM